MPQDGRKLMKGKPLGFIGLGLMGQGFTRRLIDLGYGVVGFDVDPAKVAKAAAWGVQAAKSAAEVVEACDVSRMPRSVRAARWPLAKSMARSSLTIQPPNSKRPIASRMPLPRAA